MCVRFIKDILDIKNLFGMDRTPVPVPIPQYPANEIVLRGIGGEITFTPYYTGTMTITSIYHGSSYTVNYPAGDSGMEYNGYADEGTDVIITGMINRIDCGADVQFIALNNTITTLAAGTIGTAVQIVDARNCTASTLATYNANIVDTLYAIPNDASMREFCLRILGSTTIADGVLFIDMTATYADEIRDAALGIGWRVYNL